MQKRLIWWCCAVWVHPSLWEMHLCVVYVCSCMCRMSILPISPFTWAKMQCNHLETCISKLSLSKAKKITMQPLPFSEAELLNLFVSRSLSSFVVALCLPQRRRRLSIPDSLIIRFSQMVIYAFRIELRTYRSQVRSRIFVFRLFCSVYFSCVLLLLFLFVCFFFLLFFSFCGIHSLMTRWRSSALVDERTRCNDLIRCEPIREVN